MVCAHCKAAEAHFSRAAAKRDLARYRRQGPRATTRFILEFIRQAGIDGATLLDIGAGVGVIHHELLGNGVSSAVHVESASAYVAEAKCESQRLGHLAQVQFGYGDFVDMAQHLPDRDIVTLDRVLCCYPDLDRLVQASASKARQLYIASYPRDRWFIRLVVRLQNLVRRVAGNEFRTYVHPEDRIHQLLDAAGLKQSIRRSTLE